MFYTVLYLTNAVSTHTYTGWKKSTVFVCLVLYVQLYASYPFRKLIHSVT